MFTITAFILSVVVINLSACGTGTIESKDLAETSTYRTYRVNYDQDVQQLTAYARFSAEGPNETSVILNEPGMVLFNNQKLTVHDGREQKWNVIGTYYDHAFAKQELPKVAEFTWYRDDLKSQTDRIKLPDGFSITAPKEQQEITVDTDLTLELETTKLSSDEHWELKIISDKKSSEHSEDEDCCIYRRFESDVLVLESADLEKLPAGAATLELTRASHRKIAKNATDAGASLTGEMYRSRKIIIVK